VAKKVTGRPWICACHRASCRPLVLLPKLQLVHPVPWVKIGVCHSCAAVQDYSCGTLTMRGGMIHGNTGDNGGGVWNTGTFTMYDGKIFDNTAFSGGGVFVGLHGTFNMLHGEIFGNISSGGGGVRNYGTFTMRNGIISRNTAAIRGGISVAATFAHPCNILERSQCTMGGNLRK